MKKKRIALIFVFIMCLLPVNAFALSISTSGAGDFFGDQYSFLFVIDDGDIDNGDYTAQLTNTSSSSLSDALIDAFVFNMDAELGVDFGITVLEPIDPSTGTPSWEITAATGGIRFDYFGRETDQSARLAPGDSLRFVFDFDPTFDDSFAIWTGADGSGGNGIGGGDDFGQFAVSFQQLAADGEESDLIAVAYGDIAPVPEPSTILLLGVGLLGIVGVVRKKNTN